MTAPSLPTLATDEILRIIRESMLNRNPLRLRYDGEERVLCAQMLGRNGEGRIRILCLQLSGQSGRGLRHDDGHENWRCLSLEKIDSAERADCAWLSASSSPRRPKCLDTIELDVTGQPEREPQKGQ